MGPYKAYNIHTLSLSDISKLLASHRYHENTEHAEIENSRVIS